MRDQRFTFLCTKEERASLEQLAAQYNRTKGDTIRLLILKAIQDFAIDENAISDNSTHKSKEKTNGNLPTKGN